MMEKLSITVEQDILNVLDIEQKRHGLLSRSQFINYILRQTLFNNEKKLILLENTRQKKISEFRALNEDILALQAAVEFQKKAKDAEAVMRQNI